MLARWTGSRQRLLCHDRGYVWPRAVTETWCRDRVLVPRQGPPRVVTENPRT